MYDTRINKLLFLVFVSRKRVHDGHHLHLLLLLLKNKERKKKKRGNE
jgi:hypothetical protein